MYKYAADSAPCAQALAPLGEDGPDLEDDLLLHAELEPVQLAPRDASSAQEGLLPAGARAEGVGAARLDTEVADRPDEVRDLEVRRRASVHQGLRASARVSI